MQILNELQLRRLRKSSDLRGQAVIKPKPLQARSVEVIMDVVRQVDASDLNGKAEARRPLLRDGFKIFRRQAMIPRLLEDLRDCRSISSGERLFADGTESAGE